MNDVRLIVVLTAGKDRYGINAREIVEVVPMVNLRQLPHTPDYVAGVFNYHGDIVPVIDLRALMEGEVCRRRLSSRVIIVDYPCENGTTRLLGLMGESVTSTLSVCSPASSNPDTSA